MHKFIRYQTLYLSRVGHACRPKLRGSPIGLAGCGIMLFLAVIFGIRAEKMSGKRKFQLPVGAGFRIFIRLRCEIGKGNRAG